MSAWQGLEPQPTDHTDDPLTHLIAANERLHAEVSHMTDDLGRAFATIAAESDARAEAEAERDRFRSENLTLRADLATSEQTIAALKAQLKRVKEAAE